MDKRLHFPDGNGLINVPEIPIYWQGYVPAFQLDYVSLHSELYICINDC